MSYGGNCVSIVLGRRGEMCIRLRCNVIGW